MGQSNGTRRHRLGAHAQRLSKEAAFLKLSIWYAERTNMRTRSCPGPKRSRQRHLYGAAVFTQAGQSRHEDYIEQLLVRGI